MFRRFFRHIKEGFLGFKRHFGMALASSSAVTVTLFIVAVFLALTANIYSLTKNIEESLSIVATIDDDFKDYDGLKSQISRIDGVLSVEYRSKDQEFDFYLESNSDENLKEFYETYRDDNPFKAAMIIKLESGTDPMVVRNKLANLEGIYESFDGGSNTYILIDVLKTSRIIGGVIVIALVLLASYLIYNTIKITIASRSDEIWIMRNVGAKNGYIRAPFLVEGIIIGFIGSIIPILASLFGYYYMFDSGHGTFLGAFELIPPYPFVLYLCGILALCGIVVGFIGSYISVFKFLRLKR